MAERKPRQRRTAPEPKKQCSSCEKSRQYKFFYKVNSSMFPDGMINICSHCVRDSVNIKNMDSVIGFLRQIDKPFVTRLWDEAMDSGKYPVGEYIRKVNSLQQYSDKTFDDSDGLYANNGKVDVEGQYGVDSIDNVEGQTIEFSEELVKNWGTGYKEEEYLRLEKFYQDMDLTHDIETPVHIDILRQLSYLSVERDRMRQSKDFTTYARISKTIQDMTKDAGFTPADRKTIDESTGVKSFSQAFEEVEKKGFRKPPKVVFNEDIVDGIIISLFNYYNRIVGSQILAQVPDEVQRELDEFYEFDDTPVDIDDEDYENLDFSLDENDEEYEPEINIELEEDDEDVDKKDDSDE